MTIKVNGIGGDGRKNFLVYDYRSEMLQGGPRPKGGGA